MADASPMAESTAVKPLPLIHVLYGSQTGQSDSISEIIEEKLKAGDFRVERFELDDIDTKYKLPEVQLLVLVCSSTGDGEPPDNAAKFYRRLHRKTHPEGTYLAGVRFALLGLGDTNYSSFLQNPTAIEKRLMVLGAKQFYPSGWCDDQVGTDLVADPWMEGLWEAVRRAVDDPDFVIEAEPRDSGASTGGDADASTDHSNVKEVNNADSLKSNNGVSVPEDLTNQTSKISVLEDTSKEPSLSEGGDNKPGLKSDLPGVLQNGASNDAYKCDLSSLSSQEFRKHCHCSWPEGSLNNFKLPIPLEELKVPKVTPKLMSIEYLPDDNQVPISSNSDKFDVTSFPSAGSALLPGSLASCSRVTTRETGRTKHEIVVDIDELDKEGNKKMVDYKPGDAFYFVCPNPSGEVNALLEMLGLIDKAIHRCRLAVLPDTEKKNAKIPAHLKDHSVGSCCLRDFFTDFVDFRKPVSKTLFRILAEHNDNPAEQSRMLYLCSTVGATSFIDRIVKPRLSLVDLLHAFLGCMPPVERLLEHLPKLLPRPYSVASCPEVSGNHIKFVFTQVEVVKGDGRCYPRQGLATGHLSSLETGAKINCFLKTSTSFCLPAEPLNTHLVMIGPGTGVAPYIGFLDQIRHRFSTLSDGETNTAAQRWLFFGCRHADKDFIYRDQLQKFRDDNILTHLSVSFSRMELDSVRSLDSADTLRCTPGYVQDALKRFGHELVPLLPLKSKEGSLTSSSTPCRLVIYVCGDAVGMAKGVQQAWAEMIVSHGGLDLSSAEQVIESMKQDGTYLQDIWT